MLRDKNLQTHRKFLYCTAIVDNVMRRGLRGVFVLCFYACLANLHAQDCTITHYGVNEGLSQSSVYLFLKDKNGLMWIGTGDGLNSFDGYDFKIYKHQPDNDASLCNNTIRSLNQDKNGKIWVGTDDGLDVYDSVSDNFNHISEPYPRGINLTNTALDIVGDNVYYVVTNGGIFLYSIKNHNFIKIKGTDSCLHPYFNPMVNSKEIYLPRQDKLGRLNILTQKIDWYPFSGKSGKTFILGNLGKEPEKLLIKSKDEFQVFNSGTGKFTSITNYPALEPFIHKDIASFCVDKDNMYWVAITGEGLYEYTPGGKLLRSYKDQNEQQNNSSSLKHIDVLYADPEGNIWVGTQDAGFFKITPAAEKFPLTNIRHDETKNQLSSNFIKCFYKSGNSLLVGTFDKGLNVINTRTGKVLWFQHDPKNIHSICSNTINSITADREGNIWICAEEGLCLYDAQKMSFNQIYKAPEKSPDNFSPFIFQKKNGDLLTRKADLLYKLIFKNKKWEFEPFSPNISPNIVWENDNGDFLFSNRAGGLFMLSGQNFISIPLQLKWPHNLIGIHINCFYKDNHNVIWLATNMGLIKADNSYHFIKLYGLKEGVPDAFIYGMLSDERQRIWLSTNKGISCFDPLQSSFRNYTTADGLQSNEYNSGAFYKAPDGEIFFGGVNGFNHFYPEQIADNQHTPAIRIKSIKLFDNELSMGKLKPDRAFSYTQNTFSFEISAIEYTRPADNTYAYKLEGDENKWYYAGKNRNIRYSNLVPGKYSLWVKAANSDGVWSAPKKVYQFIIQPPYWESWWFRSIISISAIGLIIGTTRYISQQKLKKLLAKAEREREIEKIRIRISTDIHDDIGAGLSRLAMISEITKEENNLTGEVIGKLDKLSSTSRELMTSLREIVWAMNPKNDQADSLLSYLRTYTYNYFEDSGIDRIVTFQDAVDHISFNPEMRRNIFLIIKEAFNNTLKYAKCSVIELSFRIENGEAIFEIKDNGIGFEKDNVSEFGNGLINMRNRCETIGGSFEINSNHGKGTTICLRFDLELFENS